MNITKQERDKLRQLAEKATPGPWYADSPIPGKPRFTVADCFSAKVYMQDQKPSHGTTGLDDALFISAANPATILALLDMIDRPAASGDVRDVPTYLAGELDKDHCVYKRSDIAKFLAASAERAPVVGQEQLQNWINVIHDNERSMGDRLQSLSSTFGALFRGNAPTLQPIREQASFFTVQLPEFDVAEGACESGRGNPMDVFIYHNEPAGETDEAEFRAQLQAAMDWVKASALAAAAHQQQEPWPVIHTSADWVEDSAAYENRCSNCGIGFFGGKRRVICKVCDATAAQPPQPAQDAVEAIRYRWLRDNGHLNAWWSVQGPEDRCANIDADIDEAMRSNTAVGEKP